MREKFITEVLEAKCRSDESRYLYRRVLTEVREFNVASARRWWDGLQRKRLDVSSLITYVAVLRSCAKYRAEIYRDEEAQAVIQWAKHLNLPPADVLTLRRRALTQSELKKITVALPRRAQLALEVERFHGLRVSTLLSLRHENAIYRADAEGKKRWWLFFRTKRGRLVEFPSRADLCKRLLSTPEPLFPWTRNGFYKLLRRIGRQVIGRDISVHDLRRTYATRTYDECKDIVQVSRMMGHARLETTKRYIMTDLERWEAVLGKL